MKGAVVLLLLCVVQTSWAGRSFPISAENHVKRLFGGINSNMRWDITNFLVDLSGRYAICENVRLSGTVTLQHRTPEGYEIGGIVDSAPGALPYSEDVAEYIKTALQKWIYRPSFRDSLMKAGDFGCSVQPSCSGYISVACLFTPGIGFDGEWNIDQNVTTSHRSRPPTRRTTPIPTTTSTEPTTTTTTTTTTTPTPTTTTTTTPVVVTMPHDGRCALPLLPLGGIGSGGSTGARFGLQSSSRWEFRNIPGLVGKRFEFSLDFKTTSRNGVLFYAADSRHDDFIAVYIHRGHVYFAFDCGNGAAVISSPSRYNDGVWHTVKLKRELQRGDLFVDNAHVGHGVSQSYSQYIFIRPPYYVGGVSHNARPQAAANMNGTGHSIRGCIRNLNQGTTALDAPDQEFHTETCEGASSGPGVEPGAFFYQQGGYIKLIDRFTVGLDLEIEIDVKPRTNDGVILSVYSPDKGDYVVVQLINGRVAFTVNNGNGPMETSYDTYDDSWICDGRWHTIKALKAKDVAILYVDGQFAGTPAMDSTGQRAADTNDPLYLGGVPNTGIHRGIRTTVQYVGCMKNVRLNNVLQDLQIGQAMGTASLDSCPTA